MYRLDFLLSLELRNLLVLEPLKPVEVTTCVAEPSPQLSRRRDQLGEILQDAKSPEPSRQLTASFHRGD